MYAGFVILFSVYGIGDVLDCNVKNLAVDFISEHLCSVHENIEANGVGLYLGDGVDSFADNGGSVAISLRSGNVLNAEMVILSIGVRANGQLAADAGLEMNARGGIVTDRHLLTSDPAIYAVGDVTEVDDLIFGGKTMVPLAGPANKQGRIAADNIMGGGSEYAGTQGTSAAKVFDLTAASTGANEKTLIKRGMEKGKDYETIIITQNSHGAGSGRRARSIFRYTI